MDKGYRLYIAYGSNMNLAQMAARCPTAAIAGAAELKGYRLLFRGAHEGAVATVEPHEGGSVPVLAWWVTHADEAALDRYEGCPWLYRKETVRIRMDGKTHLAMIYVMNVEDLPTGRYRPLGQPSAYYYTSILEGYKDAGFDVDILRKATTDSVEPDEYAFDDTP